MSFRAATTSVLDRAAMRAASASVLDRAAMRELDARTISAGTPSLELMERAGSALADGLDDEDLHGLRLTAAPRLLVLAGRGNNGGDGFVVARLLAARGWRCTVGLAGDEPADDSDAAVNLARWRNDGGTVLEAAQTLQLIKEGTSDFDLGLDAIFGTGLARSVEGADAEFIRLLNESGLPLVAADIPSGLCSDTGVPLGIAARCRATLTIGAAKPGLFLDEGPAYTGRVRVVDIGLLDPSDAGLTRAGVVLDATTTANAWPRLQPLAHKGSRGHVLIVAGSRGKAGAAVLAARGALRAGAGLVTVACVAEVQAAIAATLPEAMTRTLPAAADGSLAPEAVIELRAAAASADSIVVVGPGLSTGAGADAAVALLLDVAKPLLIDADGLNVIAAWSDLRRREIFGARTAAGAPAPILTPHPGEMGRLVMRTSVQVQLSRLVYCDNLAKELGSVVVLKGAATIVADGRPHSGQADKGEAGAAAVRSEAGTASTHAAARVAFNLSGNAGMACAGMGDVLSGIVGAIAVRVRDPFQAAALAVYVHGAAGDGMAVRTGTGFFASELADEIPLLLESRHPR